MKRWLENKIEQFKKRNFPKDGKKVQVCNCVHIKLEDFILSLTLQEMLVEFQQFKDQELPEKIMKKQELTDTEKKLLVYHETIRICMKLFIYRQRR